MSSSEATSLTPAERSQVAARERLRGMGEVEVLRLWYRGEETFDLTPQEDAIRRRWDFAKAQFLGMNTYGDTVDALMHEFRVSISQARNDIRNMRHAFGNLDEVPKAMHRERATIMILKAYRLAESNDDYLAMTRTAEAYAKITGANEDEGDRINIEKIMKERIYVEALDVKVRSYLLNFLQQGGGSIDSSKLFEEVYEAGQGSEFVNYEEVEAEEAGLAP